MERGDLAEFVKNASQIMIFLPNHMWAENDKFQTTFLCTD